MTAFATAMATLHADPNLGTPAQYRRPPFTWQTCRVIRSQPVDGFGNAIAGSQQADILAADITEAPQNGDELRMDGVTYVIESAERDVLGLSWRCVLSAAVVDP